MTMSLERRFGTPKPVIAMLHFPGLPGRPRHNRELGRSHLVDVVGRDLETLQGAGVDGVLFCNENDIPYQLVVGPEIPAGVKEQVPDIGVSPSEFSLPNNPPNFSTHRNGRMTTVQGEFSAR